MPLIKVQTSVKCTKEKKEKAVKDLSKILTEGTGKPEKYVASIIEDDAVVAFAGEIAGSAFVEVKGIGGLTPSVNKALSASICKYLKAELGIDPDKVYINYTDVAATNWGWNSTTFG